MEDERRRKPWEERVREHTVGFCRLTRIVVGAVSAGRKRKGCGLVGKDVGRGIVGAVGRRRGQVKIDFKVTVPPDSAGAFCLGMASSGREDLMEATCSMEQEQTAWAVLGAAVHALQTMCEIKF